MSDNAKDFLSKILVVDPKKRYNITQIKKHPWFNQLDQKRYMSRGLLLNKFIVPIDEEIVEKIDSINKDDIQRVAGRIFSTNPTYTLVGQTAQCPSYEQIQNAVKL